MRKPEDDKAPHSGDHAGPEDIYCVAYGTPEFTSFVLATGTSGGEHLAKCGVEQLLSEQSCAAIVGDREWFAERPDRQFRLRFAAPGELGVNYPRGVMVVQRLRPSRKRPGNRLRRLLYTHWFEHQPDPETVPDDATVRSLLIVHGEEQRGTPYHKQRSPAAARVRLWLCPGEGHA